MRAVGGLRIDLVEAGACVADLGTILPITVALVLVNGVDPVAAFSLAGALFLAAGLLYRLPIPVQPIKAAGAIAIATKAPPGVVAAAGLILGGVLLVLGLARAGRWLARIFPKPIIRGNQLGVGILLCIASVGLAQRAPGSDAAGLVVAAGVLGAVTVSAGRRIPVLALAVLGGVVWTLARDGLPSLLVIEPALPAFDLPSGAHLWAALTLLVIPQLPLTLGNAIVGTSDLARDYFGPAGARVSADRLSISCGAANVAVGVLGGVPLCHGSSGLTAYHRLGARTGGVGLVAGALFIVVGVAFGRSAPAIFGLIPPPVLAGALAYTGVRHALLVRDLHGSARAIALVMGAVGGVTRNLTYGMAAGVVVSLAVFARARTGSK